MAWPLVFSAVFLWGSNFHAITALNGGPEPLSAATFRFLLAAGILLCLRLFQRNQTLQLTLNQQIKLVILGSIGVFTFNAAMFVGLTMTSALNGALIMGSSPAVGLILSRLLLGSPIRKMQIVGLLTGFLGIFLVVTQGNITQITVSPGDGFIMLSCLSGCLFTVLAKKWVPDVPAVQLTRWTITSGALLITLFAMSQENVWTQAAQLDSRATLLIVYMAVAGTVIAYFSWLQGNQLLGPQKTSLAFNLVPVCTLLIAIFLGQTPEAIQLAGMATVLIGMLLATLTGQRKADVKPAPMDF
ncbi:DMT family transporter [Photobacterium sp. 1_MG-2023]|uniref:DMT family transporter n=1 Tax=Photobacterium sp. 1_MG-2023 TaxID=3062646 RepID=UPI0026E478ED|nr:EamA family transporter [Photobacterium sp. 1_MG-2023]MDO6706885.1 EamA family transporter [Photobacterium sp. 1_MG-2023]